MGRIANPFFAGSIPAPASITETAAHAPSTLSAPSRPDARVGQGAAVAAQWVTPTACHPLDKSAPDEADAKSLADVLARWEQLPPATRAAVLAVLKMA